MPASAGPPPPGGDEDRGPYVIAVFWTMIAVSLLVVTTRFWGRWLIRQTGWDDWMMAFTMFLFFVHTIILTHDALAGGCRHLYYLTPAETVEALKYSWIGQPFIIFGFTTGKISVGLLFLRILGPGTFWRRWIIYISLGLAFVFSSLNIIFTYAQCSPVYALWNPAMIADGQAKCWNPAIQTDFAIFLASWNVLTDTILAVMPVTIFWTINVNWRRKVGMCMLLGLGLVAAVCAAVKTQYLVSLNSRSDLTWETYNLYVWSGAEIFVIIVSGSIPPCKPIYDRWISRSEPHSRSRSGNHWSSSDDPKVRDTSVADAFAERNALKNNAAMIDLEEGPGPRELPSDDRPQGPPQKMYPAGDINVPVPMPTHASESHTKPLPRIPQQPIRQPGQQAQQQQQQQWQGQGQGQGQQWQGQGQQGHRSPSAERSPPGKGGPRRKR